MAKRERAGKRRKLSKRLLIGLLQYAMVNMVIISLVVGFYYFYAEIMESTDSAFALARSGARLVDGDRIVDYLNIVGTDENGESVYYSDEYYNRVMEYLNVIHSENDLVMYYYIAVPHEDGLIYIWDANTAKGFSRQGYFERCLPEEKKSVELAFSKDPEEETAFINDPQWGRLLIAFSPIFNSAGEPVALVGIDLSVGHVLEKFITYLLLILAAVILVTFISVFFLFKNVRRTIVKPVEQLNTAAKGIVGELSGNARFDLKIRTGDEIEELANSFRKMDADLHEYLARLKVVTADRERIHAEINVAKQIQADLLPNVFPAFPERNDFDIYAALSPCDKIGGNYYDFFLIDKDHLAMVAGDVAGDGIPTALHMVIVATLIKSRAMQGFSPAEVMQSVSEQMRAYSIEQRSFVWLAVLELSTGKGIAVNAGHEHPALRRAGKQYETQEYPHDSPIGVREGCRYRDHGFQLYPGDSLFIYCDGVKSAPNEKGECFGRQRILEALNREPDATPSVLVQTVKQAVVRFSDRWKQSDDLTMLCLKYYGPSGDSNRI